MFCYLSVFYSQLHYMSGATSFMIYYYGLLWTLQKPVEERFCFKVENMAANLPKPTTKPNPGNWLTEVY